MGVNFAGFVEIDVQGKPGKQIDFQFSERADKAMTNQLHSAYILGPSGKGTFRNRFNSRSCTAPICTLACGSWKDWAESSLTPSRAGSSPS